MSRISKKDHTANNDKQAINKFYEFGQGDSGGPIRKRVLNAIILGNMSNNISLKINPYTPFNPVAFTIRHI